MFFVKIHEKRKFECYSFFKPEVFLRKLSYLPTMKLVITVFILFCMSPTIVLFDFKKDSNISNWRIVDDGVMGGRSNGSFSLTKSGHGLFKGTISLENNGGFSSVRHTFKAVDVSGFSQLCVRLKGDGKPYQLRIKHDSSEFYSYIYPFTTSGDWETIAIDLENFYPSYRGQRLRRPNFSHAVIEELVFLFGNKKEESFTLLLDTIELN